MVRVEGISLEQQNNIDNNVSSNLGNNVSSNLGNNANKNTSKNTYNNADNNTESNYIDLEYCPNCDAILTMQKGYSNELPYWVCKGCGEMLINPDIDSDIAWICDGCGEMLNTQEGFSEEAGEWKCSECGFINKIDKSELYLSDDEYQLSMKDPYKGLADEDLLAIQSYEDIEAIDGRTGVILVKSYDDEKLYVKKLLKEYNPDIYRFFMTNPIPNMPKIYGAYEGDNGLIVIEEFIEGRTLTEILDNTCLELNEAINVTRQICSVLQSLHELDTPIIHRDIKPSNIIVNDKGEVFVIDINVAKWYDESENEDTRLLGTPDYAAPEQYGYSLSASSAKTDIYSVGILLNVMLTGKRPKDEKAKGKIWDVIEKCISLEAKERYSASELIEVLDSIKEDE